mgnify:CR=1 FL=1
MTREEKIETLENFCDKREKCAVDGDMCPIRSIVRDCGAWWDISNDGLDECLKAIGITDAKPDMVCHPPHYNQGGIECIDAIKAATVNKRGIEAVCVANVIKYLFRYETKNGLEDVYKSRWYLNRLIDEMEAKGE